MAMLFLKSVSVMCGYTVSLFAITPQRRIGRQVLGKIKYGIVIPAQKKETKNRTGRSSILVSCYSRL